MEIRAAERKSHFSRAARSSPKPDSILRQSNTAFVALPNLNVGASVALSDRRGIESKEIVLDL
jgi:hypothetical protein